MSERRWGNVNTIYQIYPRSFKDSNSDGVGDLKGIIEKLDYLKGGEGALGVDALWLSPFFPSPMADFGYDVSDYRDVHPLFGTLGDFETLVRAAHERDIKVMIDFVPNHSSDQHPWFLESRSSKDSPLRDYYVWRDPKPDGSPPNNWLSIFGGSAWEFDEVSGQYYLHTFLKEQPDLNWNNVKVRWEMKQVLRFWFELGVDGIRADAVRWIAKDPDLRDDPPNPHYVEAHHGEFDKLIHTNSRYGRDLFRYLRELTDIVEEYPDRIMIFEDYPDDKFSTRDQYLGFYSVNPSVSMPFNFTGMSVAWGALPFSAFINEFQGMLRPDEHTPVYCFGNHDNTRLVSRFGSEQARLIAILQLTLPGLPVIYYGDEIGMVDVKIPPEKIHDPIARSVEDRENENPDEPVEWNAAGRDPERTPMQWDSSSYAGFSDVDTWLPVADDFASHNVVSEQADQDSYFAMYRRLLQLRSEHDVFRNGHYKEVPDDNPDVYVFERSKDRELWYITLNFSEVETRVSLAVTGEVRCSSYLTRPPSLDENGVLTLAPYEAAVIYCTPTVDR